MFASSERGHFGSLLIELPMNTLSAIVTQCITNPLSRMNLRPFSQHYHHHELSNISIGSLVNQRFMVNRLDMTVLHEKVAEMQKAEIIADSSADEEASFVHRRSTPCNSLARFIVKIFPFMEISYTQKTLTVYFYLDSFLQT